MLTVSEMSASVTEGGLRWIRYGFINEHQAGMAVAISYRVVSICKAERTRKSGKRGEEMEWLQVRRKKQSWKTLAAAERVKRSIVL